MVTGKKRFENLKSSRAVLSKTFNQRSMDIFTTNSSLYGHTEELLVYGLSLDFDYVANHVSFTFAFIDSVNVQGDVTFEKPVSVSDSEGVGLQMLEENGILLSTKDFPPLGSITFKNKVNVRQDFFLFEKILHFDSFSPLLDKR